MSDRSPLPHLALAPESRAAWVKGRGGAMRQLIQMSEYVWEVVAEKLAC